MKLYCIDCREKGEPDNKFIYDHDAVEIIDENGIREQVYIADPASNALHCRNCFGTYIRDEVSGKLLNETRELESKLLTLAGTTIYDSGSEGWQRAANQAPKKKDYIGKHLKIMVDGPVRRGYPKVPSPIRAGNILSIASRVNLAHAAIGGYPIPDNLDKDERIAVVHWNCPTCGGKHREGLPESWIKDGRLVFVEKASASSEGE